jgi:hypothetical protein
VRDNTVERPLIPSFTNTGGSWANDVPVTHKSKIPNNFRLEIFILEIFNDN